MSLSQETLELVLRGLGEKPLADGEVIWGRYHSEPVLAAACKAKLRERGAAFTLINYSACIWFGEYDELEERITYRSTADTDDEALIEAFALAVKGGAL